MAAQQFSLSKKSTVFAFLATVLVLVTSKQSEKEFKDVVEGISNAKNIAILTTSTVINPKIISTPISDISKNFFITSSSKPNTATQILNSASYSNITTSHISNSTMNSTTSTIIKKNLMKKTGTSRYDNTDTSTISVITNSNFSYNC